MSEFLIKTIIHSSSVQGAGTGRFFVEDQKKGTIIRKQKIGSDSLHVIKNKDEKLDSVLHFDNNINISSEPPEDSILRNNSSNDTENRKRNREEAQLGGERINKNTIKTYKKGRRTTRKKYSKKK